MFDICHGCRRCFNLCDSFPRLFDLIDDSKTGELDGVAKADYAKVAEACTLCDMCFMTKCPYVPPHEFNVDFPHLMLRHRAAKRQAGGRRLRARPAGRDRPQRQAGQAGRGPRQLGDSAQEHALRTLMEAVAGIDADAELPQYHSHTATDQLKTSPPPDPSGPAFGKRKVALYATCFVDYNAPDTAVAAAGGPGPARGRRQAGLSGMLRHAAA